MIAVNALLLLALLVLLAAAPVQASGPEPEPCGECAGIETGAQFGEHVSTMAQEGHLGQEHNPGHHHGFSPLAP